MTLHEAIERLFERDRVVVGVDFDGTLAPIVDHPDQAVPNASAIDHLRALATRPGITVAIVSGRALDDLERRLGEVPGAILIGEHGNDRGEPVESSELIEESRRLFEELVAGTPGSALELKPRSVTFHYRNVESGEEAPALERIRSWAGDRPAIQVLEGKQVMEVSVAERDKGDAILDLGGADAGIVYIGDDVTDESVFAVLRPGDIGIKVGSGATMASFRVEDVAAVVEVLEVITLISG